MSTPNRNRERLKLVHEGQYVAEVDVELLITEDEWSPYLSLDDAYKLDAVRQIRYSTISLPKAMRTRQDGIK